MWGALCRPDWLGAEVRLPPSSGEISEALDLLEERMRAKLCLLDGAEMRLRRLVDRSRRATSRRVIRHLQQERQRLGRELHTGVGQTLAAIRIQVELIENGVEKPGPAVAQALGRIGQLAADALEQVRAVSHGLYLAEWERLPLEGALRQLWERSGIGERFAGGVQFGPLPIDPTPETKSLLYHAAQEGLANVIRHSRASRVQLSLEAVGGRLTLVLQDDGVGFDVEQALAGRTPQCGIGLRAIREQAALVGGKLLVASGPSGTKLEVSVPHPC